MYTLQQDGHTFYKKDSKKIRIPMMGPLPLSTIRIDVIWNLAELCKNMFGNIPISNSGESITTAKEKA
jgi:hypothetical protein